MSELEALIQRQLLSISLEDVKNGLSNILYWGFAQMGGLACVRVERFRATVSSEQLQQAANLFATQHRPSLYEIARLNLPQFSQVSFVSKIRMYLDPDESATLDKQIMKMYQICKETVLSAVTEYETSIPITRTNSNAYEDWCSLLAYIARTYLVPVSLTSSADSFK